MMFAFLLIVYHTAGLSCATFLLFFLSALVLFGKTPLGDLLNPGALQELFAGAGLASPLIFILNTEFAKS